MIILFGINMASELTIYKKQYKKHSCILETCNSFKTQRSSVITLPINYETFSWPR